jgi:DGQHR domain-containing protein
MRFGEMMPSEVTLRCQRFEIRNGGQIYPFFLGALDAKILRDVSDAPSFQVNTPNRQIASEVLTPPTEHWQRPIQREKVEKIASRFDLRAEIMPNPVLLAVNPSQRINVQEETDAHGNRTGLFKITITIPERSGVQKPLWIIDGQHRVMGLAETRTTVSPLPFVLLHSENNAYVPEMLAKIFAQVTTEATSLNPIHQAWMQFVFNLGPYEHSGPTWRAMRTAALICHRQSFENQPNPFYDVVGFNPELEPRNIIPGGFSFDAKYLQDLLKEKYFRIQGGEHRLEDEQVAAQIALAVNALKNSVRGDAGETAFFGELRSEQKYFRDAFIAGVCAYLIANGAPRDWNAVLRNLNFDETNWDVSGWVNSTSGRAGTISKKLAFDCFQKVFANGELPENVGNLCEFLQGAESYLQIEYRLLDDEDNPIRNSGSKFQLTLPGGLERRSEDIPANARFIKISSPCTNIGPVSISLKDKPYDEEYSFAAFKTGKKFTKSELRSLRHKIVLNIKADLYGDNTIGKELTLNVRD